VDERLLELLLEGWRENRESAPAWWDQVVGVAEARLGHVALDEMTRLRWRTLYTAARLLRRVHDRSSRLMTYPVDAADRLAMDYVKAESGDWEIDAFYRGLPQTDRLLPVPWEEALIAPARHAYHRFCRDLVARFVLAIERAGRYGAAGFVRQRAVWSELVEPRAVVAVLLVDALRSDLAHELRRMLEARGHRVELHFVLAELPTRTEIGMAALLPRAQDAFAVRVEQGKLVSTVGGARLTGTTERRRYLETVLRQQGKPVYRDEIEAYLKQGGRLLTECRSQGCVAVAHSTELDDEGEIAAGVSFGLFEEMLAKCVDFTDLALGAGYQEVVVVGDHGFLIRDPEAAPGGVPGVGPAGGGFAKGLRYAAGVGPVGPHLVRLPAGLLGREGDDVYVPRDTSCLALQGGPGLFVHGGLSPQECALVALRVLPAARVRVPTRLPVRLKAPERVTSLFFPVAIAAEPVETPLLVQARAVVLVVHDESGAVSWRLDVPLLLQPGSEPTTLMVNVSGGGQYTLLLRDSKEDLVVDSATVRVDVLGQEFTF
jgi:hypothetical protein